MLPSTEPIERAAQAVRSEQFDLALKILIDIVHEDRYNAKAWRLLSDVVQDPQDKITALQNALALLPPSSQDYLEAQSRLDALRVPGRADRKDAFQQALRLDAAGKHAEAGDILEDIVLEDPGNEAAWIILSEVRLEPQMQIRALKKVLEINPGNAKALARLEQLRPVQKNPMQRGAALEVQGKDDAAVTLYQSVITHSRSAADRLEATRRIEAIKQRQYIKNIQHVNPTVDLLRLTAGPVVLFAIMLFLQSGLNLLHLSLVGLLGGAGVFAGSLLISATDMRPAHPVWVRLFGTPGTGDEAEMRTGLKLLGWALLLAPFTIFLLEATYRLGILQASILSH